MAERVRRPVVSSALGIVGVVLLLSLQFDSITFPLKASMVPLATLVGLAAFPLALNRTPVTPLMIAVGAFWAFTMSHSLAALLLELFVNNSSVRFVAWVRQAVALTGGVLMFVLMRRAFAMFTDRSIARIVLLGALPGLIVALLTLVWGGLRQAWAGHIVLAVRRTLVSEGHMHPMRASGLSIEPYSLASFIALILVPLLIYRLLAGHSRRLTLVYAVLALVAFGWTFSSTGIVLMTCILVVGVVFGPRRRLFVGAAALGVAVVVLFVTIFPVNQIARHLTRLSTPGKTSVSFVDRFYGTTSPFLTITSSYTAVGYGLGGTSTNFEEIVPERARAYIADVKWEDMPALATVVGRVFAETGVVGFALFLLMFLAAFIERSRLERQAAPDRDTAAFLAVLRLALWGTVAGVTMGFGSLHHPFLWFWLAVVDSRYVQDRHRHFFLPVAGNVALSDVKSAAG